MIAKLQSLLIICLILFLPLGASYGQVTIGSTEVPVAGSILELKEWTANQGGITASKGLLLPRVSLKSRVQLTPLYGGEDNGDGTWTDDSTPQDKVSAAGMMVYNMNSDTIELYKEGVYVWSGESWKSIGNDASNYTIDCSNVKVKGLYENRKVLDDTHYIEVEIAVSSGGRYKIETGVLNGISFRGEGVLPMGTHTVRLAGSGTVSIKKPFNIDIVAKTSQGNVTCTARIPVIYPKMKYAVIGRANSVYTWSGTPRGRLLEASTMEGGSFSPTGIVQIGKLKLWRNVMQSAADAKTQLGWTYFNANGVLDPSIRFPDVILYYSYQAQADAELAKLLSAYINAGGCILFGSQDRDFDTVNHMMVQIFGMSSTVAERQIAGSTIWDNPYPIANLPNDPIINGPFGNLTGKYWGEDNDSNGSIIVKELPENSVQICTAQSTSKPTVNPNYSIVWYNTVKNFVYIGDSTGASLTDNSTGAYPARYRREGDAYYPMEKSYGAPTPMPVVNAALELNALAWLIERAVDHGINEY